jgi:hypothetical protein
VRNIISLLVTLATIFSCTNKPGTIIPGTSKEQETAKQITKPPGSFSDTLVIRVSAAVFFQPDSLQLLKLKAITSARDFESETHNWFYQMRNARMVIRKYWPRIRIMETSQARYLLFIKADKQEVLVDLDKQGDMCGIFLFDRKKAPELADMMNIDSFLGFYFQ